MSAEPLDVPMARFEELVGEALDEIPDELAAKIDNVHIRVRDDSPVGNLGLWEGIPLTERHDYGGLVMPDRITIYRRPILQQCET